MLTRLPKIETHLSAVVSDKYNFNFKSTAVNFWWRGHETAKESPWPDEYTIKRYYAEDKFNIVKYQDYWKWMDVDSFININNGTDIKLHRADRLKSVQAEYLRWEVHWSNWKGVTFSKLNSLTVGNIFTDHYSRPFEEKIADTSSLFIEHQRINKKFVSDTNQYMEFKLHTYYDFNNHEGNKFTKELDPRNDQSMPVVRPRARSGKYLDETDTREQDSKLFLYFPEVSQWKNNKIVAYLFASDYESEQDFNLHQVKAEGSYVETPYGKLKLRYVDKSNNDEQYYTEGKQNKLGIMGVFLVDDYTRYNYIKKHAEKLMQHDSSQGALVPYNFYGDWNMGMHLSINAVYNDLDINVHQHIDKPVLNPYLGQVQLRVSGKDAIAKDFLNKPMGIVKSSYFKDIIENFNSIYALDRRYNNETKK